MPIPVPDNPDRDEAPDALRADLAALYQPPRPVPPQVDEDIHYRAAERLRDFRRTRRWGRFAAAAAFVLMVFGLERVLQRPPVESREPARETLVAAPPVDDIDGSGRVDILDALVLTLRLDAGGTVQPQWDVNGDGRVDRADVDAVAQKAVRLTGGDS